MLFFKKINFKFLIISFALALLFLCYSTHLYVKSAYWDGVYFFQKLDYIKLTLINHSSYDYEKRDTFFEIISMPNNVEFYPFKNDDKQISYNITASFYPFEKPIKIILKSNIDAFVKIEMDTQKTGSTVKYSSIRINNKEHIKSYKDEKLNINYLIKKNDELVFDIDGQVINYKTPIKKSLKLNLFFGFLFFYWIIFYLFLYKEIYKKIFYSLKKNKIFFAFMLIFFAIYFVLNNQAGASINYFDRYWVINGDSNLYLMNVACCEAKRFHPYIFLPFYPIYEFLLAVTNNFLLTIFIVHSIIVSATVGILFKILDRIKPKFFAINLLLTVIFGFSYQAIIFTYSYDLYIFTAFYLSIIIYCLIKYENKKIFPIALLASLSFGVTITNIFTILIILIVFYSMKNFKKFLLFFSIFTIIFLAIQAEITQNEIHSNILYKNTNQEFSRWVGKDLKENLQEFKEKTLVAPIANKNKVLANMFLISWGLICLLGVFLALKNKSYQNERKIFFGFLFALIFNFITNFFWASFAGLLFSPNHFILWFILLNYSIKFIEIELSKRNLTFNNNILKCLLIMFIIFEIHSNLTSNYQIQKETLEKHPKIYESYLPKMRK